MWQMSDTGETPRGAEERPARPQGPHTYSVAVCHASARLSSETTCQAQMRRERTP